MSLHLSVQDELTSAKAIDINATTAVVDLTFTPKIHGEHKYCFTSSNNVVIHFDDSVLAHRIAIDIAYRLKERRDELARIAEAAE